MGLEGLASRDAISASSRLGAKLGAGAAKLFGGGTRKQAEYAAAGARAAQKLTTKHLPQVKAKLREFGERTLKKAVSKYVGMRRGGKVHRYRRMMSGGKVRGKFRFKH